MNPAVAYPQQQLSKMNPIVAAIFDWWYGDYLTVREARLDAQLKEAIHKAEVRSMAKRIKLSADGVHRLR